jgi:hypothetical protein
VPGSDFALPVGLVLAARRRRLVVRTRRPDKNNIKKLKLTTSSFHEGLVKRSFDKAFNNILGAAATALKIQFCNIAVFHYSNVQICI